MKISIAGAGWHGATLAYRIAAGDFADEVVMVDTVEGKPQGLGARHDAQPGDRRLPDTDPWDEPLRRHLRVGGVCRRRGCPPGRRDEPGDLLHENAKVVEDVTRQLAEGSPEAVLLVATNPIDEMVALAQAASGFPHRRVIGEAGVLNTARWKHTISERLGLTPDRVEGIVLGSHGETMVPIPSLTNSDGTALRELLSEGEIASIIEETRACASEIIAYLKVGSGYQAAAAAGEVTVRAIVEESDAVLPVITWLQGEYGLTTSTSASRRRSAQRECGGHRAPARPERTRRAASGGESHRRPRERDGGDHLAGRGPSGRPSPPQALTAVAPRPCRVDPANR